MEDKQEPVNIANVDDIISLYEKYGDILYSGEIISQKEHAITTALEAKRLGADNSVFVACLLHDIGHLYGLTDPQYKSMENCGIEGHETIGKNLLKSIGFNDKVCSLVYNHVDAKRYLVSTDKDYYDQLSDASKITLKYQGKEMSEDEVKAFREDPLFEESILLRKCEEYTKIKVTGLPEFKEFKELINAEIVNSN